MWLCRCFHFVGENYINVENEDAIKSSCDTRAECNDSDSDCPDYENLKDNLHIGNQTPGKFETKWNTTHAIILFRFMFVFIVNKSF